MGQSCTKVCYAEHDPIEGSRTDSQDPVMYDLMRKSIMATTLQSSKQGNTKRRTTGQHHLLYKNNSKLSEAHMTASATIVTGTSCLGGNNFKGTSNSSGSSGNNVKNNAALLLPPPSPVPMDAPVCPTRLLIRRRSLRVVEEGGGTHIYAIRYPEDTSTSVVSEQATTLPPSSRQEQCPPRIRHHATPPPTPIVDGDVFTTAAMASIPRSQVVDWITVSEEHSIYIADVGLTPAQCDHVVAVTEQVCRGQYAAYTYAKQTLGCREFPLLAQTSFHPVHSVVHAISQKLENSSSHLQLDDREPHIVKYDVTKKERQKLDMHTDKSEWTFLIALSNGCGVDYEGGGTYFECLDATVHIQKGHALIFPGKLRHCGQKILSGLRFLLVGFLVDKTAGGLGPVLGSNGAMSLNSTPTNSLAASTNAILSATSTIHGGPYANSPSSSVSSTSQLMAS